MKKFLVFCMISAFVIFSVSPVSADLVKIADNVYSVPYVEDDEKIFLKTVIPNRKATKKYLGGKR